MSGSGRSESVRFGVARMPVRTQIKTSGHSMDRLKIWTLMETNTIGAYRELGRWVWQSSEVITMSQSSVQIWVVEWQMQKWNVLLWRGLVVSARADVNVWTRYRPIEDINGDGSENYWSKENVRKMRAVNQWSNKNVTELWKNSCGWMTAAEVKGLASVCPARQCAPR